MANNGFFNETPQVMSLSTITMLTFNDFFLSDFYLNESVIFHKSFDKYLCRSSIANNNIPNIETDEVIRLSMIVYAPYTYSFLHF